MKQWKETETFMKMIQKIIVGKEKETETIMVFGGEYSEDEQGVAIGDSDDNNSEGDCDTQDEHGERCNGLFRWRRSTES